MTIDHIGLIFYPDVITFRMVGRLAFPFFAYLVAQGMKSTKKPMKYIFTLLSFGFISQIPYFMAFNIQPFERLNIFFSLFFGAITIYFFKKKSLLAFIPIILSLVINAEGTYYVVLTILFMNLLMVDIKIGLLSLIALNLPFLFDNYIQILALLALPVILIHLKGWLKIEKIISDKSLFYSLRKYFFYIYYPLHLFLLFYIFNFV